VVLFSGYNEVTNGLQEASTNPFAIPTHKVDTNNVQYPVAKIVNAIPAKWNRNASTSNLFIPIISTMVPPTRIANGNPQKAVAAIVPNCAD
jgi:hypothetical protein